MLKHSRRKLTMGFLSCILFVNVNNHSPFCLGAGYKVKPELRISKWSPTFPRLEPNLLPGLFFLCLQLGSMILIGSDWTNEREFCLQCLMVFIIDLHTLAQCKFRKLNYYFHNVFILGDFNTSDNSWDVKKMIVFTKFTISTLQPLKTCAFKSWKTNLYIDWFLLDPSPTNTRALLGLQCTLRPDFTRV